VLRGFSFQDRHSLAIGTSKEDNLRNEVFQDGAIVCHSISTLYMMSYISHSTSIMSQFLQPQEQKWNRPFTRPFFPVWQIMVWEWDYVWCRQPFWAAKSVALSMAPKKKRGSSLYHNLRRDQPELSRYANYLTVNNIFGRQLCSCLPLCNQS